VGTASQPAVSKRFRSRVIKLIVCSVCKVRESPIISPYAGPVAHRTPEPWSSRTQPEDENVYRTACVEGKGPQDPSRGAYPDQVESPRPSYAYQVHKGASIPKKGNNSTNILQISVGEKIVLLFGCIKDPVKAMMDVTDEHKP